MNLKSPKKSKSPKKRVLTAYNKFVKIHMKDKDLQDLNPKQKMKFIAALWKATK